MQGAERPGYSGEKVKKDTERNIEDTGEFVVNIATKDIAEAINICAGSYGAEINELEEAGLATLPSRVVKPPRRRKPGCFGVPTRTVHRAGLSSEKWSCFISGMPSTWTGRSMSNGSVPSPASRRTTTPGVETSSR